MENSERAKPALSTNDINNIVHGKLEWESYGGANPNYNDPNFIAKINKVLEGLQEEGFCELKKDKKNTDLYKRIYLAQDRIEDICKSIGYVSKSKVETKLEQILLKYSETPILADFVKEQLELLRAHKQIKYAYIKGIADPERLEFILKGANAIINQKEEIYLRNLSVDLYGDSKIFENLLPQICKLLVDYSNIEELKMVENPKDILSLYNVLLNPSYIYFRGHAEIVYKNGGYLFLNENKIGIPSDELSDIQSIKINDSRIYTIENLTPFNDEFLDGFRIYLGGYHNSVRCKLLKMIYAENRNKEYYHYGDIDAGGLYIFRRLEAETKIPFRPFQMDIKSLELKKDKWKPLTENDKKRLRAILKRDDMANFHDLVKYSLEHNCKLEQESFHK